MLLRRSLIAATALLPAAPLLARHAFAADAIGTAARPCRVGVTSGVHAQVLEQVRDQLAKKGFVIKITEFSDFIQPNVALSGGDIDANVYQHLPFLQAQEKQRGYDFTAVGKTVLTLMAVFSKKYKSLADLPKGAQVAIPNDPTNGGRALLLLAKAGLITLTSGSNFSASIADITANPKNIKIVELDAAQIARSLPDVDAGAITGNYAVPAGLNPTKDALIAEGADSVYTCLVVVQTKDKDAAWAKTLADGYKLPEIKTFVEQKFGGAVIVGA